MTKAKAPAKKPRVRPLPQHRSFRLTTKKYKQPYKIISTKELFRRSLSIYFGNKKIFLGLTVIQAVLTYVFIQGIGSQSDLVQTKQTLEQVLGNSSSKLSNSFALFNYLAGTSSSASNDVATVYQAILAIIVSLATIWGVRQIMAGEKIGFRDPLYMGMTPLVPFILLIGFIGLEFIPLTLGSIVYSSVLHNGLAVTSVEKFLWVLILILLALLTLYMVISSIFSLYIATLPGVKPFAALRSARELVLHRRQVIMRRFVAFPITVLLVALIIFIPLISFATAVAQPIFLLGISFVIVYFHLYMYVLYRSLI